MAYKAGFQYLEQRDSMDNITHAGVVSKKSPFANGDNTGIYDVIAEDLRVLYDEFSTEGISNLKKDITRMYEDMCSNPNFGSTAATEQARLAFEYAERAKKYLDTIENDKSDYSKIEEYIRYIQTYASEVDKRIDVLAEYDSRCKALVTTTNNNVEKAKDSEDKAKASEKAAAISEGKAKASEEASALSETNAKASEKAAAISEGKAKASESASAISETNAKTSATNAGLSAVAAKASETAAKASETAVKASESKVATSEINTKESETNAATSAANAATSETNAKTSETNAATSESKARISESAAATSETNAKTSETSSATSAANAATSEINAKTSESNAKAWATSVSSPDGEVDILSTTGFTQSARAWALSVKESGEATLTAAKTVSDAEARIKSYIEEAKKLRDGLTQVMRYKGTVLNNADLPTNAELGDVYNVAVDGHNVIWDGSKWDDTMGIIDLSEYIKADALASVATSGKYNDLIDKPMIPTKVSELVNDNNYVAATGTIARAAVADGVSWEGITGKPEAYPATTHNHDDRYYTETEINTKLASKANLTHEHSQYLTSHQPLTGYVPITRTINGKALNNNINLSASDVGAAAGNHSHSQYLTKVPDASSTVVGGLKVSYGTTALTPGSSNLATGALYFQYE